VSMDLVIDESCKLTPRPVTAEREGEKDFLAGGEGATREKRRQPFSVFTKKETRRSLPAAGVGGCSAHGEGSNSIRGYSWEWPGSESIIIKGGGQSFYIERIDRGAKN